MNKLKITALTILVLALASLSGAAKADGIGFINYKKIQDNYEYAKESIKTVDAKALELQQYLVDKEKEFKALDTPVKKKNFEDKTAKEFQVKQDAYLKFKSEKEDEVYGKIQDAAKQILIEQKLDAIIDYRVIFIGGIDITDLVIQKLNGK
jgi:Skp family chaperone for outer membrane proteins